MREAQKRDAARRLRKTATDSEQKMWLFLRNRGLAKVKFRRQVPIGPYIADFAAPSCRLIIEIDGSQHADSRNVQRRDAFLQERGWRVLRFWNDDVRFNANGVYAAIEEAIASTGPHPVATRPTSPASGRGVEVRPANPEGKESPPSSADPLDTSTAQRERSAAKRPGEGK